MNIVLIGYRGSGKTSIGRHLAAKLGRNFVDSDARIVHAAGRTIREIFEAEGETGFRRRESDAIANIARSNDLVIALGGGAVLNRVNIDVLKTGDNATIIWLHAAADILFARIQGDAATNATRPNLTAAGGLEEVQKLLAIRTPLYQAAADIVFDVSQHSPERAAEELLRLLPES